MGDTSKVYKGNVIFTKEARRFTCIEHGHLVVENGKVVGSFGELPEKFANCEVVDFGDNLIIPSFIDLHLHASQFENIGLGLDKQLLPWLKAYTFPEEYKFRDLEYAKLVYDRFVDELILNGTTRAVVFATVFSESTSYLMDTMQKRGIGGYVGKVNMDRNSTKYLNEDTDVSISETEKFLLKYADTNLRVKPIITPRFTPTCTDKLMFALGELAEKYNVPVQSHLSENCDEIAWVRELVPSAKNYADTYDRCGLFGQTPTIMAHCVFPTEDEIVLMKERGVFVAHCPLSNIGISSGLAPIRKLMKFGINVGLGTDISGGHSISMIDSIVSAVQSSKLYKVYVDNASEYLTLSEAFYLATKGSGKFFGKVGSFEQGYDFDCLVIDDSRIKGINQRSLKQRIERFIYNGTNENIVKRFAFGKEIV